MENAKRLCGLIGNPLGHSLSPVIHEVFCKELGIDMSYLLFEMDKAELKSAIKGLQSLGAYGCNVTVPYKIDCMKCVDEVDEAAKRIGAINTIVNRNGKIIGYNTDVTGFMRSLANNCISIKDQNVVMIGAGGVAGAVLDALVSLEAKNILIVNRSVAKAKNLSGKYPDQSIFSCAIDDDFCAYMDVVLRNHDVDSYDKNKKWIAVQCTSVGMHPNVKDTPITTPAFYNRVRVGVDVIYNPGNTEFLKRITKSGGHAVNGLDMLIYQAADAFELWTGQEVTNQVANKAIKKVGSLL